MKNHVTAAILTAAAGGIMLTGCGTDHHAAQNAEAPRATAAATAKRDTMTDTHTDRDNSLYEEDDVHRKTNTDEPDIIDRAESAVDYAEDMMTSMVDDAKRHMDSMTDSH